MCLQIQFKTGLYRKSSLYKGWTKNERQHSSQCLKTRKKTFRRTGKLLPEATLKELHICLLESKILRNEWWLMTAQLCILFKIHSTWLMSIKMLDKFFSCLWQIAFAVEVYLKSDLFVSGTYFSTWSADTVPREKPKCVTQVRHKATINDFIRDFLFCKDLFWPLRCISRPSGMPSLLSEPKPY